MPMLLPLALHSVGIVRLMLFERVPWKRAAQSAVGANGLTILDSARVFALLNIATHDTQAVGSEHK